MVTLMFKILEFSSEGSFISLNRGFLEVKQKSGEVNKVVLDDIGGVIFTGYGQSLTSKLIQELLSRNIVMTFCDQNFLPLGILCAEYGSGQLHKRLLLQQDMSKPFKKMMWKEIVSKKIEFQGYILSYFSNSDEGLISFSKNVLSGDSGNYEAQAAKRYWKALFPEEFRRGDDTDFRNAMLNYGYTILRSAICRAIVASGLNPMLSLFHSNKENRFPLADDFIEIFRPLVDFHVKRIINEGEYREMEPGLKRKLVDILYYDLQMNDNEKSPVFQVISKFVNSYIQSMEEKSMCFLFPKNIIPL